MRVHTGAEAGEAARAQGSVAFARGTDVYLSESAARDPLVIGHELAHVIQQLSGGESATATGLEGEAASVASGESDAIGGGAAFGSVQAFWPFDDEEETKKAELQKRDEELANTIKQLGVLTKSTDEWKKYASDPVIGGWLRAHPDAVDPLRTNHDYQTWLADPKSKPPGATDLPKPQEVQQFDPSKARGKVQGTGETVYDLQRRAEKTVWKSWSPKQKADWAHGVVEAERQRSIQALIPEKGSYEEAMWTIGEATGSYSMARAWTGESEWGVPLSGEERFNEAVLGGAKFTQAVATTELALPEWRAAEGAGMTPQYAEELLRPPPTGPLVPAPLEAAPLEQAPALGRGGKTIDELAEAAAGKHVPGQDVELPPRALTAPREAPSGALVKPGGEAEIGGRRVWTEGQVVPEPGAVPTKPQPTPGPTTDVAVGPERLPHSGPTDVVPGPKDFPSLSRGKPSPAGRTIPAPSLENIPPDVAPPVRASEPGRGPLVDEAPRAFPGAGAEKGPVGEPATPPAVKLPPVAERGSALLPGSRPQEPAKAPGPDEDRGQMIAAPKGRDPFAKAFAEPKGKLDVRKAPPTPETIEPQTRAPSMSTEKREELLAEYEQRATEKLPEIIDDVIKKQQSTKTRKRLAILKDRFVDLMKEVGDAPDLTADQRKRATKILEEARELARDDFGTVQKAAWGRLRKDPELAKIEKQLKATGDVGPGKRALQVATEPTGKGTGKKEFESLGLEHRVRLSDDPWLYNARENLLVTDAAQNEQYLEAIRRHGIWPTTETEEFVVRHGLSSQPYDFAPGSRPIPKKPK